MSSAPAAEAGHGAGKKQSKMMLIVICLLFAGMGAAVPMVLDVPSLFAKPKAEKEGKDGKEGKEKGEKKKGEKEKKGHGAKTSPSATVPFGEIVVNLSEERMSRYLRVKVAVIVDEEAEKAVTEELTKHKVEIKSKLISHLAGKTLKDVTGTVGFNKLQREMLEKFDDVLFPDGESHLQSVLFEDYVVQ